MGECNRVRVCARQSACARKRALRKVCVAERERDREIRILLLNRIII